MKAPGLNAAELGGNAQGEEIALQALEKKLTDFSGPDQHGSRNAWGGAPGMIPVHIGVGTNWDYMKQKATEGGQHDGATAGQRAL